MVEVTYDAAEALNALKLRYGRIDPARGNGVARRIQQARALQARIAKAQGEVDAATLEGLRGDIHAYSVSTVCDKQELFWRRHLMNFKWLEILRIALASRRDG